MTSRPALGNHGSGAPSRNQAQSQVRRPSKPANALPTIDLIDPALEDERPPTHNGASEARPPPRGRPPLFYSTVASNGIELPIHSFPYQPAANLPAPPRPGSVHLRDASQQRRILPGGTGVKDAPKLTAPEVVVAPVQFPGEKDADVFPWTGKSAEDTLSETLVKAGITNKPLIMNETNTARPSLWSNLKNKSGITTLSTLFVAVLEKRQQSGRLQTPNTFKPPPRLTLRDSNRETWLHDLANPTMSLKRLSRTIPHGLMGKVLLDQCLNKNIPLPRALWLAKCVGINELRAHKRKGQAGTVTWGRGWTSSVEQFLDSVISTIGQGDWKPRITYALQLATCLYKEHLLDDDHFLDWMLNGLDSCTSERLFIWLLVISVSHYWNDITSCRRRGKRLAESLLNYVGKLYQIEELASSAALQYLENTLLKLLGTRPACLLLPTSWARHSATLKSLAAKRNHPQITQAIQKLEGRNLRLLQSSKASAPASQTAAARVFRKLDSVNYKTTVRIEDLSYECMEIISNATQLISVLLQWACSYYRTGSHRIYLATRLLRRWNHLGADVYEGVVSYLHDMTWVDSGDLRVVLRIVAELVRSKHFSAGRYLQWLIATGSMGSNMDLTSPSAWPVRLITEFPLTGLSDQVRNLRCTLLRGTIHSAEVEEQALGLAKRSISQAVPALFGLDLAASGQPETKVADLSSTVRLELGIWLRQRVAQYAEVSDHVPTKDPSIEETAAVSRLTVYDYHIIRSYLEQWEDFAILADVVGIATSSLDTVVLASVADTLNYHMKAFRAIGAFDPLFGRVAMRYAAIRTVRFPERELLLSLQNLTRTVQPDSQLLQLLAYDLSRLDQRNSMAACSPASDNMGEVVQHTATYSDDEIERILSSGTSMDQQMMIRVLRKIICNLEENLNKGYLQLESHPTWFWRLRSFDESTFDGVLHEWLESCLVGCQVRTLQVAVPPLVASGCMALPSFLNILRTYTSKSKSGQFMEPSATAMDGLRILLQSDTMVATCLPQDAYRYRLEQYKVCFASDARIVDCIGEVAELICSTSSPENEQALLHLLSCGPVLAILQEHIASGSDSLSNINTRQSGWGEARTCFKSLLNRLLDPLGSLRLLKATAEEQVIAVFKVASELSLPVCQAVIEHTFSDPALEGDTADALSAALLDAVKTAVEEDQSQGLQLLTNLDASLTSKIRCHAEYEILNATSFLTNDHSTSASTEGKIATLLVQKYLTVIGLTSSDSAEPRDQTTMLAVLVDRLKGLLQALNNFDTLNEQNSQAHIPSVLQLYAWLNALLRLAAAHASTLLRNAIHTNQTALMAAVQALLVNPALEPYPMITEHLFDVAVILSDHISDDARIHVARLESANVTDSPRCHFIIGAAAPVDGWLVVMKSISLPQNPQSSSQPPTPTATHSQASPYQGPHPPAFVPQQRYLNQQQEQRQQMQHAQQAQQPRAYPQYPQHPMQPNRQLPAQLQRTPSFQSSPTPLQRMQQMQQMQARATQPSPVHSQRPTPTAGQGGVGGPVGGTSSSKIQTTYPAQQREIRQYPFVQPRWEILAESSGNPTLNETAINLSLFGARKV
ncbi:mediator of RNA polymerase II transcription subunit 12 [Ophiobolus disseminans]|uniref:Mediator of RNA polymerase II transcription subunit 12 n=1 Tax=Ophiobolus disseminans TaxID=1469910 RepID=A0A6A6ZG68_9PLEO|nr:mediator of RNA polymerase II transcription subunit 12 [Ophiobolus disseminans]